MVEYCEDNISTTLPDVKQKDQFPKLLDALKFFIKTESDCPKYNLNQTQDMFP